MIPRIIHRIWLGGPEPEWTAGFADTWRQPGWRVVEWDDELVAGLGPLHNQGIFDAAEDLAPDHIGQLRSDVVRLELLYRFGGVYVDADFECLRPIDPHIEGIACFAAWEAQGRWVNNAIMGAVPFHPFVERLIDGLAGNVLRNRGSKPNKLSGPQYLTRMWREQRDDVVVLPQSLFYPYGFADIRSHGPGDEWPDAVAVHHWQNKRREQGVPA